ncbi:MAG TPA: hypothetical protein DEQ30_11555, partial [Porphyromonadaceae bacterium]|nr:hypothetical protein [Porphyromonadaceae bacterium]
MSWGRYSTNGSSAMQPDFDDDDYGKIVELSGGQGGNDPDYSKPADYSEAQDYSGYDDPNQAAYHHGPKRGENFQTY